jgi:DinB superfamily
MDEQANVRKHVLELLEGKSAHIDLESALSDFPLGKINERPADSPHSAWDLLEHLRIAQWDIVEFTRDPGHVSPTFPEGYWPKGEGTAETWNKSVAQILSDVQAMRDLVSDSNADLLAPVPHGTGQTLLRESLLVVDHNAYHLGQIMLLKKMLK